MATTNLTKSAITALTFSYLTGTSFKGLHVKTVSQTWDYLVHGYHSLYKKGVLRNDEDGKVLTKIKSTKLYKRTQDAKKALEDAGYTDVRFRADSRRKHVEVRGYKGEFYTATIRLDRGGYAWIEAETIETRGNSYASLNDTLDAAKVAEAEETARYHQVTGSAWRLYRALKREADKGGDTTKDEMRDRVSKEIDEVAEAIGGYHGTDEDLLSRMREDRSDCIAIVERVMDLA